MGNIEYREFVVDDYKFINEVRNQCVDYLHNPTKFTPEETLHWINNKITDRLRSDKKCLPWFIILLNGDPAGYIRLEMNEEGDVYIGMDIHEKYRSQGLGQRVYKEFIPFIYNFIPTENLWLEVLKTNHRAIHIYEKLGFKLIKARSIERLGEKIVSLTYKLNKQWFIM